MKLDFLRIGRRYKITGPRLFAGDLIDSMPHEGDYILVFKSCCEPHPNNNTWPLPVNDMIVRLSAITSVEDVTKDE